MASQIKEFLDKNTVNIIGGAVALPLIIYVNLHDWQKRPPHKRNAPDHKTKLSGLEPLTISKSSNFVNIGERCNVAGSRSLPPDKRRQI
jgi:5-methyltetrahydrofolate--homocysteine methyltransferase